MSFQLSQRANNALHRVLQGREITPSAVARLRRFDLITQPNCAAKTLKEIELWLARYGLNFANGVTAERKR